MTHVLFEYSLAELGKKVRVRVVERQVEIGSQIGVTGTCRRSQIELFKSVSNNGSAWLSNSCPLNNLQDSQAGRSLPRLVFVLTNWQIDTTLWHKIGRSEIY